MSNQKMQEAFSRHYPNASSNNLGSVFYESGWKDALSQQPVRPSIDAENIWHWETDGENNLQKHCMSDHH